MENVYKGKYFTFVFKISKEELDKRFTTMVQEFFDRYYQSNENSN